MSFHESRTAERQRSYLHALNLIQNEIRRSGALNEGELARYSELWKKNVKSPENSEERLTEEELAEFEHLAKKAFSPPRRSHYHHRPIEDGKVE